MLLAVAGLKPQEIQERTEKVSRGDWSGFAPAEQRCFQFAERITRKPSAIHARDVEELARAVGEHRALDLVWYSAWCNYMTRVADAFQFPLERDNVFDAPQNTRKDAPKP